MMRVLQPIVHREAYTRAVEAELLSWFREAFFQPLLIVMANYRVPMSPQYQAIEYDEAGKLNAVPGALLAALESNRVHYAAGVFSGRFNSKISKELVQMGARYNAPDRTFRLAAERLPNDIKAAVAESLAQGQALHADVIGVLDAMQANIATAGAAQNFKRVGEALLNDLGKQFVTTVQGVESLKVQAVVTPAMRERFTAELTENLDRYVKGFAEEQIIELRKLVEQNAFAAGRPDRLAKVIEAHFGVSKRKAEFLADQETGLLVAKYRQTRYEAAGLRDYIWRTSHDVRVRDSHKALNGKRFCFASPPVTTGPGQPARRNNPGEDYRCRCVACPVFVYAEEAAA